MQPARCSFSGDQSTLFLELVGLTDEVECGREIVLAELKQRIREVKPGPDGFIYAITDEPFGAVLKIEPGQ